MKTVSEIKKIVREHNGILAQRYGITVVGIFGSCVKGEARSGSDIDLLADILRPISLLELVGAEIYLSEALGAAVDLVPKRSVRDELRDTILNEAVAV